MCDHASIKIVPTAENSWGIEDTYDVKCAECGQTLFAGKTENALAEILAHLKYSRLLGREYLDGIM